MPQLLRTAATSLRTAGAFLTGDQSEGRSEEKGCCAEEAEFHGMGRFVVWYSFGFPQAAKSLR